MVARLPGILPDNLSIPERCKAIPLRHGGYAINDKPILPLVCIFGCKDPVVAVVHTSDGCTCAANKYQPRCMQHLMRLDDTDGGRFTIVEDFRVGDNWS